MISYLLSVISGVFALLFLYLEYYGLGLWTSVFSYFVFGNRVRADHGLNSIYFLFLMFFGLYGFSIPISIFFGLDIGWHKVAKFPLWDQIDPTLFSYLISNQIGLLALVFSYFFFSKVIPERKKLKQPKYLDRNILYLSFTMSALASISQLANFIRVGGFKSVAKGKAYYQSAVSELPLDISADGLFYIAVALFSISLIHHSNKLKNSAIFIALGSFYLLLNIMIGERGALVVAIAVAALGYTYFDKVKWPKLRYVIIGAIAFFFFNVITILREPYASFNGLSFFSDYSQKLIHLANPANTEFSAAAYNYRIYLNEVDEIDYRFGNTYMEIAVGMMPTYVLKDKPQTITYEYRDRFHSERKEQGSIAGTAFSSLLEAYLNFHYWGPFLIYLLFGTVLILIESFKFYPSAFSHVYYLMFFNIVMIFSRTGSKSTLSNLIFITAQVILTYMLYRLFFQKIKTTKS